MLRNDWKSQLPRSCLSPKRDRSIKQTATVVQEVTLLVAKSHLLLQIWRFSDLVSTIHAQVVLLLYCDHIPACHASSGNEDSQRNIHPSAPQGGESLPYQEKKRLYWTTNLFRWYSMIITAHCGRTNTNFCPQGDLFSSIRLWLRGLLCVLYFFTSPVMNVIFLVYSLFHSDDFKWGKTREVVRSEGEKSEDSAHGRQMLHWSHSLIMYKIDLLLLLYILF